MRDAHIPMLASERCQNHANCPHVLLPPSAKTPLTSEKISLGQLLQGRGDWCTQHRMLRNKSFFNTVFDNSHFHSEAFTISRWCWNCHRCIIFHHLKTWQKRKIQEIFKNTNNTMKNLFFYSFNKQISKWKSNSLLFLSWNFLITGQVYQNSITLFVLF